MILHYFKKNQNKDKDLAINIFSDIIKSSKSITILFNKNNELSNIDIENRKFDVSIFYCLFEKKWKKMNRKKFNRKPSPFSLSWFWVITKTRIIFILYEEIRKRFFLSLFMCLRCCSRWSSRSWSCCCSSWRPLLLQLLLESARRNARSDWIILNIMIICNIIKDNI